MNLNQVTVGVADIGRAVDFYRRLGLELIVRADHYARFLCPGGATFSVHLDEAPSSGGVLIYFECEDLDARVAALKAAGLTFDSDPQDQRWLWREASNPHRQQVSASVKTCPSMTKVGAVSPVFRVGD